jgi:hypothetical protein
LFNPVAVLVLGAAVMTGAAGAATGVITEAGPAAEVSFTGVAGSVFGTGTGVSIALDCLGDEPEGVVTSAVGRLVAASPSGLPGRFRVLLSGAEVVGLAPPRAGVAVDVEGEVSAESADDPRPADRVSTPAAVGPSLAVPARLPLRLTRAGEGAFVEVSAVDDSVDAESALDPVDPPEPVVSANATGTDATADPTPSATASAPTRPT